MLLKSIKYHNFRPFLGDQKIEFERVVDNPDANVTIILGDNTFGKSTFVLSFIWCLYGESRFTRPNDILNKKIEAQLSEGSDTKASAYVEIEFDDDDKSYTLRRTQEFIKNDKGKLIASDSVAKFTYINEAGEVKDVGKRQNDINVAIRSILPLDLSSFFFFEGEKNNEITKKDLGKSVRTLLGLEAFDKMRSHLYGSQTQNTPYTNSVMGDYLKKQNDESDVKAQIEFSKKEEAEKALESIEKEIEEILYNITGYDNQIEEINDKLRKVGPAKELQKRRDQIANELRRTEVELEKKNKAFLNMFSKESLPLFVTPLLEKAEDKLKKMNASDKGIRGIEALAIRELLKRGECLCGTDLKEGSLAYKNVEKYIEYVPPRSLGTLVRDMLENIEESTEKNKDFVQKFEDMYQEILRCRNRINELESEDREKLAEINKIGLVDTEDAEKNLIDYKRKISELRDELSEKTAAKERKKSEIETAQNNFNMYKSKSDNAKRYQLYYKYAEAIYNWVNDNYSKKEEDLRERLSEYISKLFTNMYSGKRSIRIDERYNIDMTVDGTVVDDTGGLRVIQYFAYVGGLVKLAYEIMQEREADEDGNYEALGEQYPLVLDAAFSHADENHTKNIAKELANASSQLIFAIMHKDWVYAKEGLEGRVGRMYELRKIDEVEVQIVEV